jgi:hypothetical protein
MRATNLSRESLIILKTQAANIAFLLYFPGMGDASLCFSENRALAIKTFANLLPPARYAINSL